MKAREIIKKLKEQGWYLEEHGSRHDKWAHSLYGNEWIPLPRHYDVELSKTVESSVKRAMQEVEAKKRDGDG